MRPIERIYEYLQFKEITPYEFEKTCNLANGYLRKQQSGRGTTSSDVLEKVHEKYPDLNILWLLFGEGNMTGHNEEKVEKDTYPTTYPTAYPNNNTNSLKEGPSTDETVLELFRQQNATLLASNADKDKIIAMLEEKLKAGKTKDKG